MPTEEPHGAVDLHRDTKPIEEIVQNFSAPTRETWQGWSNITTHIDRVAAFTQAQEEVAERVWLQAWLVYEERQKLGPGAVEVFANEVGISASWAYKLLKLWTIFGHAPIQDLSPSHHILAAEKSNGDHEQARVWAEEAAANGYSKERFAKEIKETRRSVPRTEGSHTPTSRKCPLCGEGEIDQQTFSRYQSTANG